MVNYYYNEVPELEIVLDVNAGASYEFDQFVVLRAVSKWGEYRKGTLFYMTDAGCSCPEPFDGEVPEKITKRELIKEFDDWAKARLDSYYGGINDAEYAEATRKLHEL